MVGTLQSTELLGTSTPPHLDKMNNEGKGDLLLYMDTSVLRIIL